MRGMILAAVLTAGMAGTAWAEPVVEYKGRRIQVADGDQSRECLTLVRKAIDMTAELPPKQRTLAAEVKDLRCSPIPEAKRTNAVVDNTIGVYTMQSPDTPGGYIRFPLKPGSMSAAEITMSLMGNGSYAHWHQAYLSARQKGPNDPTARKYYALLTKSDLKAVLMAECDLMENDRIAVLALGLGERRAASIGKRMSARGCP